MNYERFKINKKNKQFRVIFKPGHLLLYSVCLFIMYMYGYHFIMLFCNVLVFFFL